MIGEKIIKTYKGTINIGSVDYGDGFVTGVDDKPIILLICDDIEKHGEFLSVRYFISDKPKSLDELTTDLFKRLYGYGDADVHGSYSEYTGFLWWNENFTIGGHDLMKEIEEHDGKYIHLEIGYSKDKKED